RAAQPRGVGGEGIGGHDPAGLRERERHAVAGVANAEAHGVLEARVGEGQARASVEAFARLLHPEHAGQKKNRAQEGEQRLFHAAPRLRRRTAATPPRTRSSTGASARLTTMAGVLRLATIRSSSGAS